MSAAALLFLAAGLSAGRADTTLTLGDTPTVVAFVGADQAEIMFSADWAPILSALEPDLDAARPDLEKLGVVVREVRSPNLSFRSRGQEWRLEPTPAALLSGYYLWSPEGPRYVCRGPMKKDDLVRTVTAFLDQVRAEKAAPLPGCAQVQP